MVIFGNIWQYMAIYGYIWLYMVMYGYVWLCMARYGYIAIHPGRFDHDLTTTELWESLANKGNHPLLWPDFKLLNYSNLPRLMASACDFS